MDYSAQIAALDAALAAGELKVESDGDVVWYKSTGDLLKARDHFVRLQAQASSSARPSSTVAVYDPS